MTSVSYTYDSTESDLFDRDLRNVFEMKDRFELSSKPDSQVESRL